MNHEKQHQQLQACIDKNLSIAESAARFFSEDLISLLHSADTVIGNLETLADDSLKMSSFPCFNTHSRFLDILQYIGFDDLIVTNNHSKDFTYEAWMKTCENISKAGMKPHGFDKMSIRSLKNIDDIFLNTGSDRFNKDFDGRLPETSFLPRDKEDFKRFVNDLSKSLNKYINYYHAGKEYSSDLSEDQTEILNFMKVHDLSNHLATFFVHSHVPGTNFQRTKYSMLFENGLGNFCSFQDNLNKQVGKVLEYTYNKVDKTLSYNNIYTIETIEKANVIQTVII
jgi:hypothetical protein